MQLHAMLNAYDKPLEFELPVLADGSPARWRLYINTANDTPHDIYGWEAGPLVKNGTYRVAPYSIVVLAARRLRSNGGGQYFDFQCKRG